jgi:hypothetical protein
MTTVVALGPDEIKLVGSLLDDAAILSMASTWR